MLGNGLQVSGKGSKLAPSKQVSRVVKDKAPRKISVKQSQEKSHGGQEKKLSKVTPLNNSKGNVHQVPPPLSTKVQDVERRSIEIKKPILEQPRVSNVNESKPRQSVQRTSVAPPNVQRKSTDEKDKPTLPPQVIRKSVGQVETPELNVDFDDLEDFEEENEEDDPIDVLSRPSILSKNYKESKKHVMVVDDKSTEEEEIPEQESQEYLETFNSEYELEHEEEMSQEEEEQEDKDDSGLDMDDDAPVIANSQVQTRKPSGITFSSVQSLNDKTRRDELSNEMYRHIQLQTFGDLLVAKAKRPKRLDAYCLGRGIMQPPLDIVDPYPIAKSQLKEFQIDGYTNFLEKIQEIESENHMVNEQIVCVFTANWIRNKKTWSEDCNLIEAAITFLCRYLEPVGYLLWVRTGSQKNWKESENPFKTDRRIMLKTLPTIKIWDTEKRLAGNRLFHLDNITVMLED